MPWPSDQDYNEAIQNPKTAFEDSDLQQGQVESYPTGVPKARSGNFAAVYKVFTNGTPYAVKCFRYDNSEYERRYPAIASHLGNHPLSYFVPFRYMTRGIRVGANWYPILKMKWTEGKTLATYIEQHLRSPQELLNLASSWTRLLKDLQSANIAHGDLQHGNVLVVRGELKLVDYDGMYVPALDGSRGLEAGHRNYQHPERSEFDFGPYLDNFSAWLIYISILALSVRPSLWQELNSGDECLLFRKQDLTDPDQSPAFRLLRRVPDEEIRDLVERFEDLLWLPPSRIPVIPERTLMPRVGPPQQHSTTPDWLKDHIDKKRVDSNIDGESPEHDEIGDASWITGHIQPPPTDCSFQNPPLLDRLFALSVGIIACGFAGLQSPPTALATAALYVMALSVAATVTAVFWLFRYYREPATAIAHAQRNQLKEVERESGAKGAKYTALKKDRQRAKDKHIAAVEKVAAKKKAIEEANSKELAEIDKSLRNALHLLNDQRRKLAGDEANEKRLLGEGVAKLTQRINTLTGQEQRELNQLDSDLGQQIRHNEAQVQQLKSRLDSDLKKALREYQDQIVLSHLHKYRVADAKIQGIGQELTRRLAQAGYVSAADVALRRYVNVPGIGAKKLSALGMWVVGLDNKIRPREAPQSLPAHKVADIGRRYDASIRQLQQTLSGERSQFATTTARISAKYADQKRLLETERSTEEIRVRQRTGAIELRYETSRNQLLLREQKSRLEATKRVEECTQRHQAKMNDITQETEYLRNAYAADLERLNNALAETAKKVREVRWRRDQVARSCQAYSHLTFWHYCARTFGRT